MSANSPLAKAEQRSWLEAWLLPLRAEQEAVRTDELRPSQRRRPSAICTVNAALPKHQ